VHSFLLKFRVRRRGVLSATRELDVSDAVLVSLEHDSYLESACVATFSLV